LLDSLLQEFQKIAYNLIDCIVHLKIQNEEDVRLSSDLWNCFTGFIK